MWGYVGLPGGEDKWRKERINYVIKLLHAVTSQVECKEVKRYSKEPENYSVSSPWRPGQNSSLLRLRFLALSLSLLGGLSVCF